MYEGYEVNIITSMTKKRRNHKKQSHSRRARMIDRRLKKKRLISQRVRLKQVLAEDKSQEQNQLVEMIEDNLSIDQIVDSEVIAEKEENEIEEIKKEKKAKKVHPGYFTSFLVGLLFTFSVLIVFTVRWLFRTWPKLALEELIFQIMSPLQGTGTDMIIGYVKQAAIPAVVGMLVIIVVLIILHQSKGLWRRIGKSFIVIVSVISLVVSVNTFWKRLDVTDYIENQAIESEFIESEYVDPRDVELTFPETKRNLIYIFMESMEVAYTDEENGGALEQNVIPQLTNLAKENECFNGDSNVLNGGFSPYGATWTMGGLFTETSALPLILDIQGNAMDTQESFFPEMVNIGDILSANGYSNTFLCGSDASFAGRDKYFKSHGNFALHDYEWAKQAGYFPETYRVWWGFEDRILFEIAKDELTQLAGSGQPFNYSMLTADTHFEDGYVDEYTQDVFGNQYSNVIFHSDEQVTEFVSWIQSQPWYENTTIVLCGDHPTMDSDYLINISPDYERKVYTTYINSATQKMNDDVRAYSTLDNFPTTLAALGVNIEGNHLGLGVNLFSDEPTLVERFGIEDLNEKLKQKSKFMSDFSHVDKTTESYEQRYLESAGRLSDLTVLSYQDGIAKIKLDNMIYDLDDVESAKLVFYDGETEVANEGTLTEDGYEFEIEVSQEQFENINLYVTVSVFSETQNGYIEKQVAQYQGNVSLISEQQHNFDEFLVGMTTLNYDRYAVFMATQNTHLSTLSKDQKQLLKRIGLSNSFWQENEDVRLAVLTNNSKLVHTGKGYIRDSGSLPNGIPYAIASATGENTYASISLTEAYEEYADYENGIQIVIWDMSQNTCAYHGSFAVN